MKRFRVDLDDQKLDDIRKKIFDETGEQILKIVIFASFVNVQCARVLFGRGITEGSNMDVFFCFLEQFNLNDEIWTSEYFDEVKIIFMKQMIKKV